jgi:hypothetical protein
MSLSAHEPRLIRRPSDTKVEAAGEGGLSFFLGLLSFVDGFYRRHVREKSNHHV